MQVSNFDIKNLISEVSSNDIVNELEKASSRYHINVGWIAIIFDPLFALTDYYNIPGSWLHILVLRLSVAAITLVTLLAQRKYKFPSFIVALVPFLLISLQNAYTYGLIENDNILGHTINYIALLIGGGMFILWRTWYSVGVIVLSAMVTAIFVAGNRNLELAQFFIRGGLLLAVVGVFMIILIKVRYDLTLREIKARLALKAINEEMEKQKLLLEEKNEKITDSIRYAQRIQKSILGDKLRIEGWFA
ncbi:MAG: hypothetical protein H7Y04_16895, partial [Verrucomicrobia bacterium]|nr:hypothetical protein [Cytophagales bacterium]